ncbi:MAG: acetyl-CoA carboxylase biotin carboxyl carrier protein subunit [Parvibaculum sp.]
MARLNVKSEITGKVWKIEAKAGDKVSEDDPIIILESMKMEIPVMAPVDGTIIELLVAEEETVEEDQIIAIMEEG